MLPVNESSFLFIPKIIAKDITPIELILFMHFCPGTMATHAESINSDLLRELDKRLRHTQH